MSESKVVRPLLLLDVDGVLNPLAPGEVPVQFTSHLLDGYEVWLSPAHGVWLTRLTAWFDLVWATTWEYRAVDLIAPILGLSDMPVITFGADRSRRTWKLPDVQRFAGDRPMAWIDDDLHEDAFAWAAARAAPTLLLRPDSRIGFTEEHYQRLEGFGRMFEGR